MIFIIAEMVVVIFLLYIAINIGNKSEELNEINKTITKFMEIYESKSYVSNECYKKFQNDILKRKSVDDISGEPNTGRKYEIIKKENRELCDILEKHNIDRYMGYDLVIV